MADQDMSDIGLDSDPRDMEREEEDSFIKQPKERDRRGQEVPVVIIEDETERRLTSSSQLMLGTSGAHPRGQPNGAATSPAHPEYESFERSCVVIPENEIEAHRISNNYKFGLKKWKSHVTARPITTRSEIVQDLFSDISKTKAPRIVTFRPSNVIYSVLIGWWLSLIYILIAGLMFLTIIGKDYGFFCIRMAKYFIWPFGKFVHQVHQVPLGAVAHSYKGLGAKENGSSEECEGLLPGNDNTTISASYEGHRQLPSPVSRSAYWKKPQTYLWLLVGIPILWPIHALIWFLSWFMVISIPVAKNTQKRHSEIIMYTHQAINLYYYKLTVDGVNVILVNLLVFVVLSIVLGFADEDNVIADGVTLWFVSLVSEISVICVFFIWLVCPSVVLCFTKIINKLKCILGVLAIVPLTYYVGMAITSISAQSSFAVGAILNATFGSMVEVILFIIMLNKGRVSGQECYQELVKSSLTGAILVSILFIPGMSMVVGGIKFRSQNFNPKSANVSAALLFVSIAGMFSPTIFSLLYGHFTCEDCDSQTELVPMNPEGQVDNATVKHGFTCKMCIQSVFGPNGDRSLYDNKVAPLVYCCAIILPISYIVGLVFTMKTHSSDIYEEFETQLKEDTRAGSGHSHGSAHWSRVRSIVILLLCATAIALCGDIISNNIQPLLEESGLSEYFIGVTLLSLVAELPEVVNGIQFALQNNVNLGIEIGSSTAIQVCLVQVPILVLVDIIYPMGFHLIFAEVHFWAVIFSVIVINYIFQDGKSDYFQGTIVVFIYILLMMMYVFTTPPDNAVCINKTHVPGNATETTNTTLIFGEL